MTGNAGAYGPDMGEAAKRTVAKINDAGGVLGRKLELFVEDSESSAAVAANLSQKFINVHKCQSLVGYWGTPEGMSSRPIAVQNKVVLMVSSAANAITEGDTQGFVWRFQMKATDWGIVISRAAERLGFKTVGVMGLQNAFVLPIMKVFEERMTAGRTQGARFARLQPRAAVVPRRSRARLRQEARGGVLLRPAARFRLDHARSLSRRLRQQSRGAVDHGRRGRQSSCRPSGRRSPKASGISSRCPT